MAFEKQTENLHEQEDLYKQEKEKNRQSKMRIVQLENEISARIEDVNKYFISKDKLSDIILFSDEHGAIEKIKAMIF